MPVEKKKRLLENFWVPSKNYNSPADAKHLKKKSITWLVAYSPRLAYSRRFKDAFSINIDCCFGSQPEWWEVVGIHLSSGLSLSTRACKVIAKHMCSPRDIRLQWNMQNLSWGQSSRHPTSPVFTKINRKNKKSNVLNCFLHHFSRHTWLRGKNLDESVLIDLCNLHIETGDSELKDHFKHHPKWNNSSMWYYNQETHHHKS